MTGSIIFLPLFILDPCPTKYEKRPGQHCGLHGYGSYSTLEEALSVCSKDEECTGVEDLNCFVSKTPNVENESWAKNHAGPFRLCSKDPFFRNTRNSIEFWKPGVCRYMKSNTF